MNAHVAPPSGAYFVEYFEHYLAGSIVKWKRFVAPKRGQIADFPDVCLGFIDFILVVLLMRCVLC